MKLSQRDFMPPGYNRRVVGQFVDVVSGAFIYPETDLYVPGCFPLRWTRYYNSARIAEALELGSGFMHRYGARLEVDDRGLSLLTEAGLLLQFPAIEEDRDGFERAGVHLERISSDLYRVSLRGLPTFEMSRMRSGQSFRLSSLLLREGWARVSFDDEGLLQRVQSSDDGHLTLTWSGKRISQVRAEVSGGADVQAEVRYEYSDSGLLERVYFIDAPPVSYSHDAYGRLRRVEAPGRAPLDIEYDDRGRCVRSGRSDGSDTFTFEYYPDAGQTIVHDAEGNRWIYTSNEDGAVTHILDPCMGATEYSVDDRGRVLEVKDPVGTVWQIEHDFTGAPIAAATSGREISLDVDTQPLPPSYHRVGAMSLEWTLGGLVPPPDRRPDAFSLPADIPASLYHAIDMGESTEPLTRQREVDERGREICHWFTDGRRQSCEYEAGGSVRAVVDFDGNRWEYEHDSNGRMTAAHEPNGAVTRFEWSQAGALLAVIDPLGNRTAFRRDGLGRVTAVHRNARRREEYRLDGAGQLMEKVGHADRVLLTCEQSERGLLRRVECPSGEVIDIEWDEASRLLTVDSRVAEVELGYDASIKRRDLDARGDSGVEHHFGRLGLLETIVAEQFSTCYDRVDLATLVVIDPTGGRHELTQLGFGISKLELTNGFVETTQHDPEGRRLLGALHKTSAPDSAWVRRYTYTDNGDLRSVWQTGYGEIRYEHDAAHRLIAVVHPEGQTESYDYDLAGNILNKPGASFSYGRGNLLTGFNGEPVEHDERDSIRLIGRSNMTWLYYDELDQLRTIKYADGRKIESEYDGLGRRIHRRSGDEEWRFFWDSDRLIAEQLPDETFRVYVYLDDRAMVPFLFIDYESIDADPGEGRVYTVHTDHLGCPNLVLDAAGRAVWQARIGCFGEAVVTTGSGFHQPLRYPGHYFDRESGLHWTRFRVYSPDLGRYLQPNPVGVAAGTNLYAAPRSPVSQVDLLGLFPSGLRAPWTSSFQPELRPLQESGALDLWRGELERTDPLSRGVRELEESETRAYSAIQSCRQLINRLPSSREELEPRLLKLEARWFKTVHTTEEFSTFSLPSEDFRVLIDDLDALLAEIKSQALIDDDEDTLA